MVLKNLFPGGKPRALTLSYDDGVGQDLRLMDILREQGMKATFNVNAGLMNGESWSHRGTAVRHLTSAEIAREYAGFELAVHGYTHPFLALIPADAVPGQIIHDREAIERIAGYPVRGMAYPYGNCSDALVAQLKMLGIVYSRTVASTRQFELPQDFMMWNPTCHHNDPDLDSLCDVFLAAGNRKWPCLFYLWGHSYEFDVNDNWQVIEKFAEKMARRSDIWYATNIEIYDYAMAVNRLVSSADGTLLLNPSAISVWVSAGEAPVCVEPGQVVRVQP